MAILAIIAVIALGGYAYGFIKTRELSALRKEMKLRRSWTYTQSEV
ncbi:TPA: hypothetical protein ACWJ79_004536 [Escherichia coli]|nr:MULTISPECIES: hypothetical protein [Enterobacteriaceae]MCM4812691.1 hypothetical protein [Escherichia coli]MDJ6484008.1 hypothetical protein [Salmonella enterica]MDX7091716.1 hypothetical protein [Klebsiella oxytoca]